MSLVGKRITDSNRRVIWSAGVRVAVLPITGIATILQSRVVSDEFGVAGFASFALIAALPLLVPSPDLGMGAAITNLAAGLPSSFSAFKASLARARKILTLVSVCLFGGVVVVGATWSWTSLLSLDGSQNLNWSVVCALTLFAASIPASLGTYVLVGLGKNHWSVLIQGIAPVSTAICVVTAANLFGTVNSAVSLSTVGIFAATWLGMFVALRILAIRRTGSDLGDGKVSVPGDTPRLFAATAVPMLMISVVLPFSFQSGRLILSWFSDAQQMAIFSASFVSFLPVFSIAQVSGRSLWGDFARDRSIGLDSSLRFISSMKLGALLGGVCGAGLVLVGSRVSEFAVSGTVVVPQSIFWILGVLVFVQAIHLPSGMYLTDASGLRFQAVTSGLMCIFVVLASILGSSLLGAVGPVLALAVGMIVFQFIPCLVKAIRLLQSARLDLMSRSR